MPKEIRKRGKKHKKSQKEDEYEHHRTEAPAAATIPQEEEHQADGPSWIIPGKKVEDVNPEAPYGYVELDVKAYFRTVDVQIREWQDAREQQHQPDPEDDSDPNEQRRLFFVSAMSEMRDKEKQLATDAECSVILERMMYSMDDFVRRVFMDSLSGSYATLVKHRFASHVCQTLFNVSKDSLAREMKGITPTIPDNPEQGELRTMSQLILDISEELLPDVSTLIMDPFASHVVRSLLTLLCPTIATDDENVRSKKSATWKAKQGEMKSIFQDKGKGKESSSSWSRAPPEFNAMARRFIEGIQHKFGENEVRAMAADRVASPGLQLLLQVEAEQGMADAEDSLMDRVTQGLITACRQGKSSEVQESDFLGTLLRDTTSSHLLEVILMHAPQEPFDVLWKLHFKGRLAKLGLHPIANFVVAKAATRASETQILELVEEVGDGWNKLIKASRTGVLRTVIDRAASSVVVAEQIRTVLLKAFGLTDDVPSKDLIPSILVLVSCGDYESQTAHARPSAQSNYKQQPGPNDPKLQGSLLIQALLRIPQPHNQYIIDSFFALPVEDRIKVAQNQFGSRIFDAFLESPTVPAKSKRQLVMEFIGHYQVLVDDKHGSWVGDECWKAADTYLKEKIARSLLHEERALAASFYGKFFAKRLYLSMLQRKPGDWRDLQVRQVQSQTSKAVRPSAADGSTSAPKKTEEVEKKHNKRKAPADEIDALFDEKLGKKVKRAALEGTGSHKTEAKESKSVPEDDEEEKIKKKKSKKDKSASHKDSDLEQVLNAIGSAPRTEGKSRKKK